MSMKCIPPHTPLLYSKTGNYRGVPIFLIVAPKHRLWVFVRTASVSTINVLSKNIKKHQNFPFLQLKKMSVYCMGKI